MQKPVRNSSFLKIKKDLLKCLPTGCAASCHSDCFSPDPLDTASRQFTKHLAESKEDKFCMLTGAARCRDINMVFQMALLCFWISLQKCRHCTL